MKSVLETIFYEYSERSAEFIKAVHDINKKHQSVYEELGISIGHDAYEVIESAINADCGAHCLLGFKLGIAVALNLQSEREALFEPEKG